MAKLGAVVASGALRRMKARMDPSSVNGGPLLGLNGVVVKSHGGTDAPGFANAIKVAADLAASDYAAQIGRNMERLGVALRQPAVSASDTAASEQAS
jgi:glycerol-3-phosphate acyltransferase PlsX